MADDYSKPPGWRPDPLTQLVEQVRQLEKEVLDLTVNTKELSSTIQANYVTQDQFKPIRVIVYGMVGAMLLFVLGAFLSNTFKQPSPIQTTPFAQKP